MKYILGFNNKYKISNKGEVYSFHDKKTGRKLKFSLNKKGYRMVTLYDGQGKRKTVAIHRLVATCYLCNRHNKPQVNHKNGNKEDNNYKNLEWATNTENFDHAKRHLLLKHSKIYSKHVGVCWKVQKQRWCAYYHTKDYKQIYLGQYKEERDAIIAYEKYAKTV